LALGILIVFDAILITAAVTVKIKQRFFAKHQKKHSFRASKQAKAFANKIGRNRQYQEIGDPEAPAPYEYHIDYEMEPRIKSLRHRPSGFEELGAIEDFSHEEHFNKNAEEDRTDLHLFVESLSKCLGNSNFGLSFEFEDLKFQPRKSPKPILSQVSGRINAGSLWGVMGASGAGKCELSDNLHA
jgi:ABC-type multidrug transport system fused ATPase/permease subunit